MSIFLLAVDVGLIRESFYDPGSPFWYCFPQLARVTLWRGLRRFLDYTAREYLSQQLLIMGGRFLYSVSMVLSKENIGRPDGECAGSHYSATAAHKQMTNDFPRQNQSSHVRAV